MKWLFCMDHYHYARWASVYLLDIMHLQLTCPDIYNEFNAGNFSFSKTKREFSKMAADQLHEQNNDIFKSVSGVTNLFNREDQSAF